MKNLFKYLIVLSIPTFIYVATIVLIDPYSYFNEIFKSPNKEQIARTNNQAIDELLKTKNLNLDNIIVGDSRSAGLDTSYISEKYGENFYQIGLPAAKLNEIYDLIIFLEKNHDLNKIIITLNFNMFNGYAFSQRTKEIISIYENPSSYIFNFQIFKTATQIIKDLFYVDNNISAKPKVTKEVFWERHIATKSLWQYSRYKYPENYEAILSEIDTICDKNNIDLKIILVPHHIDDIQVLEQFLLQDDKIRFYKFLSNLSADVINYDYNNRYTINKDNFTDPVHFTKSIGNIIVDEIFSNELEWGVSKKDNNFIKFK
jgi:hypothetical protein